MMRRRHRPGPPASLRRFLRGEDAAVSVEFILAMPMLFWAFAACFVFFDGYRQSTINLRAAYTISDMISRETAGIDSTYIDSMQRLLALMARSGSDTALRVTILRWEDDAGRHYVDWSASRGFPGAITNTTAATMAGRLPLMSDGERIILVETSNTYTPVFKVGISPRELQNFVFTRPRFAPQIAWVGPRPGG